MLAAISELAALYELLWLRRTADRRTRVASLRYRLALLGVDDAEEGRLMAAILAVHGERDGIERALSEGEIEVEDAGLSTKLLNAALDVADEIALGFRPR